MRFSSSVVVVVTAVTATWNVNAFSPTPVKTVNTADNHRGYIMSNGRSRTRISTSKASASSSPHPPEDPPSDELLLKDDVNDKGKTDYFAKKIEEDRSTPFFFTTDKNTTPSKERTTTSRPQPKNKRSVVSSREEQSQRSLLEARIRNDALAFAIRKGEEVIRQAQIEQEELDLKEQEEQHDQSDPNDQQQGEPMEETQEEVVAQIPAKPLLTLEQREELNESINRFVEDVLSPMAEVQPGVPRESIKGAALLGATAAFLASKGIVLTGAAGLTAAYVAISQGVAGDLARTVGGIAWDVKESATKLVEMANPQVKGLSKELVARISESIVEEAATDGAYSSENISEKASTDKELPSTASPSTRDVNGSTSLKDPAKEKSTPSETIDSETELVRVLEEAETAIEAADKAIAQIDETFEVAAAEESDLDDAADRNTVESDLPEAGDIVDLVDEDTTQVEESLESALQDINNVNDDIGNSVDIENIEEETTITDEDLTATSITANEEQSKLIDADPDSNDDFEDESVDDTKEDEILLKENPIESGSESKTKGTDDTAEDEDDDDWLAAIELAQEGIEGKIVGLEDAIKDDSTKASWDAAGNKAQSLLETNKDQMGEDDDDDDDDDDEDELDLDLDLDLDLEALGKLARAAVEKYEANNGLVDDFQTETPFDEDQDKGTSDSFSTKNEEPVGSFGVQEFEEIDENEDIQQLDDMVVSSSSSALNSETSPTPKYVEDWSTLTVEKLKNELRFRGLKAYGKKSKLIEMLEEYDRAQEAESQGTNEEDTRSQQEIVQPDLSVEKESSKDTDIIDQTDDADIDDADDDFDLFDVMDLEELGRQARAAVELGAGSLVDFDAEEPSDEVLMQLESEESVLLGIPLDNDDDDDNVEGSEDFFDIDTESVTEKDTVSAVSKTNFSKMTVAQLKDELRARGLRVSGKKAELVSRLEESSDS